MASRQRSPRATVAGALLLVALAFLAAYVLQVRRDDLLAPAEVTPAEPSAPIELDRFSARLEKTNDIERLAVSVHLRATAAESLGCFVFVVARSERGARKTWAIWPPSSPGMAISAGGHFHAAHPATGHPLTLTSAWERIDAVLPLRKGQPPFDTVALYVVADNGNILLSRPFAL